MEPVKSAPPQNGRPGPDTAWRPLPQADQDATEELRMAVVLNGGVSLAVWMGGVVVEINRLTKRHGVYGRLLTALNSRARADVIAGTSAGGINGGALALGQVYPDSDVAGLRDVWAHEGDLRELLQEPWTKSQASLLKGNAKFHPALRVAFAELLRPGRGTSPATAHSPEDRPIELLLTTTLLRSQDRTITDSLGAEVHQPSHTGQFRFRRLPPMLGDVDHFAPPVGTLADRLALASRCTASFPVAFEPVRVRSQPRPSAMAPPTPLPPARPDPTGLQPDMSEHANFGSDRWVVDGGVLMNTPLRPVLDAIQTAPSHTMVRRALLLVVPDPYRPEDDPDPDEDADAPTVANTLSRILKAIGSQTVAEELRQLEEHNLRSQARRDARTDLLRTIIDQASTNGSAAGVARQLTALAQHLFGNYRDIRTWRAGTTIAALAAPSLGVPAATLAHEVRAVLRSVVGETEPGAPPAPEPEPLPWVPRSFDGMDRAVAAVLAAEPGGDSDISARVSGGWEWGVAALERLAFTVHDLLKRALWAIPTEADRARLTELRNDHSLLAAQVRTLRQADTMFWAGRAQRVGRRTDGMLSRDSLGREVEAGLREWLPGMADAVIHLADTTGMLGVNDNIASTPGLADADQEPHPTTVAPRQVADEVQRYPLDSMAYLAKQLVALGSQAAALIPQGLDDPDNLLQADRLQLLRKVFACDDLATCVRSAIGLEVCYLTLVDTGDLNSSEQVIDLVRISAGIAQPYAETQPALARVAGLRLGHFAAFLKQAWRVNDWIWGRLDAANRLVTMLLDPVRLRRQVLLRGGDPEQGARAVLRRIVGEAADLDAWPGVLAFLAGRVPLGQGRTELATLADLLITELANEILAEEEPALSEAVDADQFAGDSPMSAGATWRRGRFGPTPTSDREVTV